MTTLTLGKVTLVDKSRDHMTVIQIIVVMGTKYIGGDNTGKVTSMLFIICPAAVHEITC